MSETQLSQLTASNLELQNSQWDQEATDRLQQWLEGVAVGEPPWGRKRSVNDDDDVDDDECEPTIALRLRLSPQSPSFGEQTSLARIREEWQLFYGPLPAIYEEEEDEEEGEEGEEEEQRESDSNQEEGWMAEGMSL